MSDGEPEVALDVVGRFRLQVRQSGAADVAQIAERAFQLMDALLVRCHHATAGRRDLRPIAGFSSGLFLQAARRRFGRSRFHSDEITLASVKAA